MRWLIRQTSLQLNKRQEEEVTERNGDATCVLRMITRSETVPNAECARKTAIGAMRAQICCRIETRGAVAIRSLTTRQGSDHLLLTRKHGTHTYTDLNSAICNEETACKSLRVNDEIFAKDVSAELFENV